MTIYAKRCTYCSCSVNFHGVKSIFGDDDWWTNDDNVWWMNHGDGDWLIDDYDEVYDDWILMWWNSVRYAK